MPCAMPEAFIKCAYRGKGCALIEAGTQMDYFFPIVN